MTTAGDNTAQAIRERATELFFEQGYAATSLRQVAAAVGLKVPSLYNHITGKEDLLRQVMGGIMDDLFALQADALATEGDTIEVLRAVVACHVRFHAERAKEVYIGNENLRSLHEGPRTQIVEKRNRYEHNIQSLIERAGDEGLASVIDSRLHTFSIVALGTHVSRWFHPGGRLSLDDIIDTYTKFALRELAVPDADARVDRAHAAQREALAGS